MCGVSPHRRHIMVNANSPYDAAHGALAEAKRVHAELMVAGPFMPSSAAKARQRLVNPVRTRGASFQSSTSTSTCMKSTTALVSQDRERGGDRTEWLRRVTKRAPWLLRCDR
jgi:hypothetical protein